MAWLALIIYAATGVVAGFLGGLLGIGGGLIVVPALTFTFYLLDFPQTSLVHLAVGTSLAAMVFTAAASAYAHFRKKGINWKFFRGLAFGIIFGCIGSALVAKYLSSKHLGMIFGFFECVVGVYFCFFRQKESQGSLKEPFFLVIAAIGVGIGGLSTLLGIGGGIITVPVLSAFRVPMKNAIATSAATGFVIAIIGAFSFLVIGIKEKVVAGSIGFLYLPAFILIAITAALTAPIGAKLTYVLPTPFLKRLFGVVLLIGGLLMLYKSYS